MLWRTALLLAVLSSAGVADTLTLKDGRKIEGMYLGGDSRQVRMAVGESVSTFDIRDISNIQFGEAAKIAVSQPAAPAVPAPPAPPAPPAAPAAPQAILKPERPVAPAPPAAAQAGVEIPAGTAIVVRMIDDVDSERDRVGQTFRASLDEPVMLGAETVVPRGADVVAKLVDDKQSGKLSGRTELTMDLVSIQVGGKTVDIDTQEVTQASESRTGRTAKVVGGTAALGAIIGAIAGGGKGAAVGAASGAGLGGAIQVMTKGQRVRIPAETRLQFTLQQPVRL